MTESKSQSGDGDDATVKLWSRSNKEVSPFQCHPLDSWNLWAISALLVTDDASRNLFPTRSLPSSASFNNEYHHVSQMKQLARNLVLTRIPGSRFQPGRPIGQPLQKRSFSFEWSSATADETELKLE